MIRKQFSSEAKTILNDIRSNTRLLQSQDFIIEINNNFLKKTFFLPPFLISSCYFDNSTTDEVI